MFILTQFLTGSLLLSFFAPWLYLTLELGGAFRHHIGRGLQEHVAMVMVMITVWLMVTQRELTWKRAALGGLAATFGFYLRMDHLGVLAASAVAGMPQPAGSFGTVWKGWFKSLWRQKRRVSLFGLILGLAVLSIPLRNKMIGGMWVFTHPSNLNLLWCSSWSCTANNFIKLLFAYDPALPCTSFYLSMMTAVILLPGVAIAVVALFFRKGPLVFYPLGLSLILLGLVVPYIWVKVVAYPPRFSIHLLPLAVLSLTITSHRAFEYYFRHYRGEGIQAIHHV